MPGSLSSRRTKRRAVIIGGSMSGLFTAAFLRQIGWDVDVYERSSVELVGRGAGITGHPELLDALEGLPVGVLNLVFRVAAIAYEQHCSSQTPAMVPLNELAECQGVSLANSADQLLVIWDVSILSGR